jgi:hypothetical protein
LGAYSFFMLALQGIYMAYLQLDVSLPKYMMRKFSMGTLYPVVQAVNPFLIIFIAPIAQILVPATSAVPILLVFAAATAWQAASFLWIPAFSLAEWAVIVAIVTLTIGESVWLPRMQAYIASILPEGKEGYYSGWVALPAAVLRVAMFMSSYPLLDRYCPSETSCSPIMWAWTGAAAALTPVLCVALYLWDRWRHSEAPARV